jgi:hypothetical protein
LRVDAKTPPAGRPLQQLAPQDIALRLKRACAAADGLQGAHCIHELWMRGAMSINIEGALEQLWRSAAASIPEWLPMRYIDWLPTVYETSLKFRSLDPPPRGDRISTWCCWISAIAMSRMAFTSA